MSRKEVKTMARQLADDKKEEKRIKELLKLIRKED